LKCAFYFWIKLIAPLTVFPRLEQVCSINFREAISVIFTTDAKKEVNPFDSELVSSDDHLYQLELLVNKLAISRFLSYTLAFN